MDKKYLIIIFVLFLLALLPNVFAVATEYPNSNPYSAGAVWHFNETSGTTADDSIGTYDLETDGDWVDAVFGKGLKMTYGSDTAYTTTGYPNMINSTDFFLSVWFNSSDYSANPYLLNDVNGAPSGVSGNPDWNIYFTGNKMYVECHGTLLMNYGGFQNNKQYHLVLNHNKTQNNITLWINGTMVNQSVSSACYWDTYNILTLGYYDNKKSNFVYDDLIISNTTSLTNSQIINLYEGTTPVSSGSIQVTLLSPTNNTINNTNNWNFAYNVSSTGGTSSFNKYTILGHGINCNDNRYDRCVDFVINNGTYTVDSGSYTIHPENGGYIVVNGVIYDSQAFDATQPFCIETNSQFQTVNNDYIFRIDAGGTGGADMMAEIYDSLGTNWLGGDTGWTIKNSAFDSSNNISWIFCINNSNNPKISMRGYDNNTNIINGTYNTYSPSSSSYQFFSAISNVTYYLRWNGSFNDAPYLTGSGGGSGGSATASSCSLFTNHTGTWKSNQTDNLIEMNVTNYFNNVNIPNNGNYKWNVQCTQDNGSIYWGANNYTLTEDIVLPVITTNFTNNLSFYQTALSLLVNLSDENLYRVNITIDNIQRYYNDTLTGYTNWLYNFSFPSANLSVGTHTLKVEVADGHTSNKIDSYQVSKGFLDNSLNFRTKTNYISIVPQDLDLFADFNYEKQIDRYTFDYIPNKIEQNTYSFVVSSTKDIQIINNDKTEYKTWLISGNNWIDFYMPELKDITPKISRISKNRVRVDIDLTKTNINKISRLSFNSIGDLNINSYNYSFYVGNYTVIFSSPILESTTTTVYLNITYNSSFISDINAILNYNGTYYSPDSKVISSSSYLFSKTVSIGLIGNTITNNSISWNFNITGITTNNTNQSTRLYNQTIEYISVYNCSYANESQALNFSYLKEIDNSKMTANSSGIITIWSNPLYKKTFNLKYSEAYNSTYCIYPSTQNLTADIQFAFTAGSYIDENYIKSSIPINTTNHLTQNIYFTDITSSTAITITLYDSTSNLIPGYNIEAWKYDLALNDYTLMDTQRTDQNGQVVMYLVTGNNEYVFKVKDTSGALVYTSVKMKLYTTSYTFRLSSTSELGPTLFKLSQFGCPLLFTNSTSLVTAVYNDIGGLGSAYYLKLYTSNITNSTLIGSTSSTFTATTLSLNVPMTPNFYTAIFYIDYKADSLNHAICSISIDRRTDAQTLGLTETLLMSAIFIGTLALIGITIGAEIALILLLVGFVALMAMGLLTFGATYGIGGLVVVIFVFIYKLYKRGY
jgi:hypothetical protein